jgi:SAM-dependent methyltransferase
VLENDDPSWGAPDVVPQFATDGYTDAGEAAALAAVRDHARGDVLDIGVGGGRTTGLLQPLARTYVGVDISPEMLALARERFPAADLREGDAVGLAGIPDRAFDLVVFSYNGLDAVNHADRATALASMVRVTRPGGKVLFSSLNLDGVSFDEHPLRLPGGPSSPRFRYHAGYALRHPGSIVRSVINYRQNRQAAADGDGWAMRPLRAHEFRFVVHFATMEETVAEARFAGLEVLAAYAEDGSALSPDTTHTRADYVHFVCTPARPSGAGADPQP